MKNRIWVLIALVVIIFLVGSYIVAVRVYHVDQRVHHYVVKTISSYLGVEFDASSFSVFPWSLRVSDVRLKLKDAPITIETKAVTIGFNPLYLISNHFYLLPGVKEVILDTPRVIWILGDSVYQKGVLDKDFQKIPIKNIPRIRVNIVQGTFGFIRGDSTFVMVDHFSGWLDGHNESIIELAGEGRILSVSDNTTITGTLNRDTNIMSIDLVSKGCNFSTKGFSLVTGDINPTSGILDLELRMSQKDTITFDGLFSLANCSFSLRNTGVKFDDVALLGRFQKDTLYIEPVSANIWNVHPSFSGQITLKPEPIFSLTVEAEGIEIGEAFRNVMPKRKVYPEGNVDVVTSIEGSFGNFNVTLDVRSDDIKYDREHFQDFKVGLAMVDDNISFKNIHMVYRDHALNGNGTLSDIYKPLKKFNLLISAQPLSNSEREYSFTFRGSAQPKQTSYKTDVEMSIFDTDNKRSVKTEIDKFRGSLSLQEKMLTYNFGNSHAAFQGTVKNPFTTTDIEGSIRFDNLPLMKYISNTHTQVTVQGKGDMRGNRDSITIMGDFRIESEKMIHSLLSGKVVVKDIFKGTRSLSANAWLLDHHLYNSNPMNWKISAASDFHSTTVGIYDQDNATLNVTVTHGTNDLVGFVEFDDFPLERIIDVFVKDESSYKGRIRGKIEVGGTLGKPHITTLEKVKVLNFNIGAFNRLSGTTLLAGSLDSLVFSDVDVSRDTVPILTGNGRWLRGHPFVMSAHGENIALNAISDIISTTRSTDGSAEYSFTMSFTKKEGTINGEFTVRDGHFLDVPFDESSGILSGGSSGFRVSDFTISKKDVYSGKGSASSGYFWKNRTESTGLRMNLNLKGDLLRALPHLTGAVKKAHGDSQLILTLGGTWEDPSILDGELTVNKGTIEPGFLVDRIDDVNAHIIIEPSTETMSQLSAVRIQTASCLIENIRLTVRNVHPGDGDWERIKRPMCISIVNSSLNLDFGIITGAIEKGKYKNPRIELNVPGFMQSKEKGTFQIDGLKGDRFIIGASDMGTHLTPYVSGRIIVLSGDINYPLLSVPSSSGSTSYLDDMFWDIEVQAGSNVNYVYEEKLSFGGFAGTTVSRIMAKLDETSAFTVYGRLSDGSFRVSGTASSMSGIVSYYGTKFDIERATLDLDTEKTSKPAILTARARTVVTNDSTGVGTEIFLNVNSIDKETGERRIAPGRIEVRKDVYDRRLGTRVIDAGALGFLEIEFTSTNPMDDTQEKILARLGITPNSLGSAATRAFASGIDTYYFDPLLRSFEETMRKYSHLDVVRFTPSVLGNFMQSQLGFENRYGVDTNYLLFDGSSVMVGEYFLHDWFLSYSCQYGVGQDFLRRKERGFFHEVVLQYLLKKDTKLQINYDYDNIIQKGEKQFAIRHDFDF